MLNQDTLNAINKLVKMSAKYMNKYTLAIYILPDAVISHHIAIPVNTEIESPSMVNFESDKVHTKSGKVRAKPKLNILSLTPVPLKSTYESLKKNKNMFINESGTLVAGERYHAKDGKISLRVNPQLLADDMTFTNV